jgi:hypothetical protein
MQRAITRDQLRAFGPYELTERILQRFGRQIRVEPRERIAKALRQDYLRVVTTLGFEVAESTVSRWAKGIARPHPGVQKYVVSELRKRVNRAVKAMPRELVSEAA